MESAGDLTVMVLLVVLDFCKLTEPREFLKLSNGSLEFKFMLIFLVRKSSHRHVHLLPMTQLPLRQRQVRDVHVVVELSLQLSRCSLKAPCGIRNASAVPNASDHLTLCLLVMVLIRR